jgi:hypothetical protein
VKRFTATGLGVVFVAALASTSVASASGLRAAASRPPCIPKVTTLGGKHTVVNCGPATATLRVGGKSYSYRDGFCSRSSSTKEFDLDLGTLVLGARGNAGKPYLKISLATVGGYISEADFGGKKLVASGKINFSGSTLKTKFTGEELLTSKRFTGSWDCHGALYNAP